MNTEEFDHAVKSRQGTFYDEDPSIEWWLARRGHEVARRWP